MSFVDALGIDRRLSRRTFNDAHLWAKTVSGDGLARSAPGPTMARRRHTLERDTTQRGISCPSP